VFVAYIHQNEQLVEFTCCYKPSIFCNAHDRCDSLFDCPSCPAKPSKSLLAIELLMFQLKNVRVPCYGGKKIVRGG
jgi:hypothetical protein